MHVMSELTRQSRRKSYMTINYALESAGDKLTSAAETENYPRRVSPVLTRATCGGVNNKNYYCHSFLNVINNVLLIDDLRSKCEKCFKESHSHIFMTIANSDLQTIYTYLAYWARYPWTVMPIPSWVSESLISVFAIRAIINDIPCEYQRYMHCFLSLFSHCFYCMFFEVLLKQAQG